MLLGIARKRSVPDEPLGDENDVLGFEIIRRDDFAIEDGLNVDPGVLHHPIHIADDFDAFQVGGGKIGAAGFHDGIEDGEGMIGEDFAGMEHGAIHKDGEGGGRQ